MSRGRDQFTRICTGSGLAGHWKLDNYNEILVLDQGGAYRWETNGQTDEAGLWKEENDGILTAIVNSLSLYKIIQILQFIHQLSQWHAGRTR